MDASILREWWPLAASLVLSIAVGMLLGWLTSLACGAPKRLRPAVVVAASIGNINTIPLLVVASLCQVSIAGLKMGGRGEGRRTGDKRGSVAPRPTT